MPKKLYDLEAAEVSLVPLGANKRKFLIFKSQGDNIMDQTQLSKDQSDKVEAVLKSKESLSDKAKASLKAIARIFGASEEVKKADVEAVLKSFGKEEDEDEDVKKAKAAKEAKEKAEAEDVEKAKAKKAMEDKEKEDKEKEELKKAKAKEEDKVSKSAVIKSDGSLDLSGVPEDVRGAVEAIYKGQQDAVKKAADLEAKLNVEKDQRVTKEFQEKVSKMDNLGDKAELATILKELSEKAPEASAKLETILKSANDKITQGNLFKELGSSVPAAGRTTWEQIEKSAMTIVAKSAEPVSKEQAVEQFLETTEGKRMYADYKDQRGGI